MKRWLRVTLPHDGFVMALMLLYVMTEAVVPLISWFLWGAPITSRAAELLIQLAVLLYAAHRVTTFHPLFHSDYRNWLKTTPWTSRYPLPVGPIHLVVQDGLVLAALAGLAWARHPAVSWPHLILKFLFVYELALAITFSVLKMAWFAYTIGFGLGLIVLLWQMPQMALPVAAAFYLAAYAGLRRALDNFENWNLEWLDEQTTLAVTQEGIDRMRRNVLGWPFDSIRPRDVGGSISYRDGLMLSLILGWWMFVILQHVDPGARVVANFFLGFVCLFAAGGRMQVYCWGYAPPINLWGRIFTLRWIIPGYDYVFIAPLLGIGITAAGISAQLQWHVPVEIAAPATLTLLFTITFTSAPTLERWRLTGRHRLSPATLMANKKAEVTQV
ncbi:MAG: hypothetical protein ACM3U2_20895 [Deltaproteobacteria bacterium]